MQETEKIWMNGELVDWADAKVHVLSHALHYGSGVFEGIRAYETDRGTGVFRARTSSRRRARGMQETEKIWMNGELVDWADAKVHVLSHATLQLGVFEVRAYRDDAAGFPAR